MLIGGGEITFSLIYSCAPGSLRFETENSGRQPFECVELL